jgi:hypothetical protein
MPNKEFLEKYNLYQKFYMKVSHSFINFNKPSPVVAPTSINIRGFVSNY